MMLMERTDGQSLPSSDGATAAPAVEVRGISKTYPGAERPAVEAFTLAVTPGEVLALLGPSGCGKTTVLRMIAGLERPDSGIVQIAGELVSGNRRWVPPERRSAGMVFQDYALFPHLTVQGNVAFGLNRLPRAERPSRMTQVLALTGLTEYARRYPHELSGGQQQRVAIARAIAPRPDVVLLDEPFSNLDAGMREQVRAEVLGLLRTAGVTVILVTHDQDEAFVAADRIAVMSEGRLHQVGTGEELYYHPATRFVAGFVGIANFVPASLHEGGLSSPLGRFEAPDAPPLSIEVALLLRPEQIEVAAAGMPVRVVGREFHGHDWLYVMRDADGNEIRIIGMALKPLSVGDEVHLRARVAGAPAFPIGD